MLQIGLVAPTLRILGGHSVQAARLLEAWSGDGEVHVRLLPINPDLPRVLAWLERARYIRTAMRAVQFCLTLLRRTPRLDLLHVFATSNSSYFLSAMPAVIAGRMFGTPVVVNYRGDAGKHLARSALVRWTLRHVHAIVVPSEYFQNIFEEIRMPALVVSNVADLRRFHYRRRGVLRPQLLSTRNFEPIYNVECTLRAFALVQRRYPDATLVLAGTGSRETALRRLVQQLRVRNVAFAGPVPYDAIHRLYDAADVYVQTPVVDNMPGSLVEAFASGLPVVATNVGGVPVLLQDGVHGLLVPADDHAAAARAVITLIEDPAAAGRMAAAAAATCSVYDARIVRERWREVYRSIAARSIPGRVAGTSPQQWSA